jgi:hypothetical protein
VLEHTPSNAVNPNSLMLSTSFSAPNDCQIIWQLAQRVNWSISEVVGGDRQLDFSRPFLPNALVRASVIACLSQTEQRLLNQIRGNSYLHFFGLCEEFILPSVLDYVKQIQWTDLDATQAFLHFAAEESKHILLFQHFAADFAQGFGYVCDCVGTAEIICKHILTYHPLAVSLMTLHIEWMTQRHYLESVRDNRELDPLFCRLLRYHWLEEAQHAKLDTLMVRAIAQRLSPAEIEQAIADYFTIISLLDQLFHQQVQLDLKSLERAGDRRFSESESAEIQAVQIKSYEWTFLWSGMTHQSVRRTFGELHSLGEARLIEQSARFS